MSSGEFLVEIGCEELPAEWLDGLIAGFAAGVQRGLEEAAIPAGAVRGWGTPRRLVACAEGVPAGQPDRLERKLGPPARVGRTPDGEWTRAALGFARRIGLEGPEAADALDVFETDRGAYVGIESKIPGRPAAELLPAIIEGALRGLAFPKAMHWDASIAGTPFPFGRPIRWIVALFDGAVVPFRIEVAGGAPVVAANASRGHRFRSRMGPPGAPFAVDSFRALRDGLRERFVVLDPDERKRLVLRALGKAAEELGGSSFEKPGLHHHLIEWPGAVLGRYDDEFRALPEEVRRAVLVHHQKYLPIGDECAFLTVVNMPDDPGGAIRRGAERVVRARLRDARFFWDEALARPLGDRQADLERVAFHPRFGNLREHSARVERLARWVAGRVGADVEVAGEAARMAKCDLTSTLVGEFPSLQGEAGGRILEAQGAAGAVWMPVYDQYRPLGLFSDLPQTVEGAAVGLADRAATLAGLFAAGEAPSGSGDPFGLRRAALGMLAILRESPNAYPAHPEGWPTPAELLDQALSEPAYREASGLGERLGAFVADRLPHALSLPRFRPGVVRAVLTVRGVEHPVADSWRRIGALDKAAADGGYVSLATAHKRARRILTPEARGVELRRDLLSEDAEVRLGDALRSVEREVGELSAAGSYDAAFTRIAGLAPRVDAFFDEVLVMAEDPEVRANRLALLARLDALFREVGDLSQIEASATGS